MDLNESRWNFHGFEWISIDLDGVIWILMDFDGFGWIWMDLDGFGRFKSIWMDLHGFAWIWMDFDGFLWIWMDLDGSMDGQVCGGSHCLSGWFSSLQYLTGTYQDLRVHGRVCM